MKRFGTSGLWRGMCNGSIQVVNVVGTYGAGFPIVRVEHGNDKGKAFAINWDTGNVIKKLNLK